MKKLFLIVPFILFADVNPFDAGNLNSPNPYGLTPTEKAILNNKKSIQKNQQDILSLKKELKSLKDELVSKSVMYEEMLNDLKNKTAAIDTIVSEINAINDEIIKLKKRVDTLDKNISFINTRLNDLDSKYSILEGQITQIQNNFQQIVKIQNENFKYLTDSIQNILKEIKNQNLSPKEAFNKAKKLFSEGKLDESKKLFLISLRYNYLPATSNFYLGEIAYKQKKYKEALAYYKKSVELYPKKTYFTAKLLYHTGIAFKNLGMKKEAKLTFEKIIKDFKNSKYASLAKKEVDNLK